MRSIDCAPWASVSSRIFVSASAGSLTSVSTKMRSSSVATWLHRHQRGAHRLLGREPRSRRVEIVHQLLDDRVVLLRAPLELAAACSTGCASRLMPERRLATVFALSSQGSFASTTACSARARASTAHDVPQRRLAVPREHRVGHRACSWRSPRRPRRRSVANSSIFATVSIRERSSFFALEARRRPSRTSSEKSRRVPAIEQRAQRPDARAAQGERIRRARRREAHGEAAGERVEPVGERDGRRHVARRDVVLRADRLVVVADGVGDVARLASARARRRGPCAPAAPGTRRPSASPRSHLQRRAARATSAFGVAARAPRRPRRAPASRSMRSTFSFTVRGGCGRRCRRACRSARRAAPSGPPPRRSARPTRRARMTRSVPLAMRSGRFAVFTTAR